LRITIVGAGLYGAVCAQELRRAGHDCRVIEKREHIAGNIFTRWDDAAQCHEHVYGAHIFHTSSAKLWNYVNRFTSFNHYVNRVKARSGDRIYPLPINLMTLYMVFGAKTPAEAEAALAAERIPCSDPANMEEFCLAEIGPTLYRLFIEGYTTKQWGRHPRQLPASIIKRLPIRTTFDDNYFNDQFQGIPIGGYTAMVEAMLEGVPVETGKDYLTLGEGRDDQADLVIYTGPLDAWFDYSHGHLEYRTLRFEREWLPLRDFQGNAVVNYVDAAVPYTRILEHKHFDLNVKSDTTLITREYPAEWAPGDEPYYPINDDRNTQIHSLYRHAADGLKGSVHFGGRLAEYRYYDMHQVIGAALAWLERSGLAPHLNNG
jgi:UDP-galactopyranose mutase